jgi:hypothetical protein
MDDRTDELVYVHLPAGSELPDIKPEPCRVIVVIDQQVSVEWQEKVSEWIVAVGCLYMMAWGLKCSSWDDSVDWTNREAFNCEEISDDNFVMTTWHENVPLDEAFVHCRLCAFHPTIDLPKVIVLDITSEARAAELMDRYRRALDDLEDVPKPTLRILLTDWFNRMIKRR